jgi:hypothetical protein
MLEIFYSYAHEDEKLREELEKQLSLLKWQGLISDWNDHRIVAGSEWASEINAHLDSANIILLLISPDFMASDYCYGVEVKRAMERHEQGDAYVIPVILRPVYWQGAPFGKLKALPKDGIPVTDPTWFNLDRAFFDVAEGIRKVIDELKTKSPDQETALVQESKEKKPKLFNTQQLTPPMVVKPEITNIVPLNKDKKYALQYTLTNYSQTVWSVSFSPDGQTLASGSADNTIKLWNWRSRKLLQTLEGHANVVLSEAFSPDGQTLASGSADNTIKLWDISRGELLFTLKEHSDIVWSVAFSPDGQTLASGSADNTIKLWDISRGVLLHTIRRHSSSVRSVAFSPDGQTLASGSADNTIKLWNWRSRKLLQTLKGHAEEIRSVTFSPDGQTLASGSVDNTIKLWE